MGEIQKIEAWRAAERGKRREMLYIEAGIG